MIYYIDPKNVLQKTKMAKENLKGKSYRNKVG